MLLFTMSPSKGHHDVKMNTMLTNTMLPNTMLLPLSSQTDEKQPKPHFSKIYIFKDQKSGTQPNDSLY